ncbi:MAG: transposase [Eubacteriales bacterium]|nr:transposase [Eubacteriales bacterium]
MAIVKVHNSSTQELTYQTINTKRDQAGMEDYGVLNKLDGVAVHDCWSPYWKYKDVTHVVCNGHLLRELTGVEQYSQDHTWVPGFKAPPPIHEKDPGQGSGRRKNRTQLYEKI